MKKYLTEVDSELRNLQGGKQPSIYLPDSYVGSEYGNFKFYNIRVPKIRALLKKGFSFSNDSIDEQWTIWDYIWHHSKIYEQALIALHFANKRSPEELYQKRTLLLKWIKRIDNWALSDEFSNIVAKLYELKPKNLKPTLEKWNRSRNPWERRNSMVGLFYYSRLRKKYPSYKLAIDFIDPHLEDQHYYVQKAVGWTLRECWNVYPEKTYKYLEQRAHRIPPGGWTAATEKLSKTEKAKLTQIRKAKRKSN